MDPLLGSPCVVQVRSFLEGQVGSEWGYACEGAREPGIRSGEGDMFSAWTLWNSSCPDKITVLLIFLLGILGSKSTRELKNFSFLPKWHHPVWGSAVPLGMWGSILPSSQPLMPWLWPDTQTPYQTPLILPTTPLPGTPGLVVDLLWARLASCRERGRSLIWEGLLLWGLAGRDRMLPCAVTAFTAPSLKCFVIYVRNMVWFVPDVTALSPRFLNELLLITLFLLRLYHFVTVQYFTVLSIIPTSL